MREHKTDGTPCWCNPKIVKVRPTTRAERKYNELLMAVENKYEGETRHQTALRLIKSGQNNMQTGRTREDVERKRKFAKKLREEKYTLEEIRKFMGYKSVSGVQRILGLTKQY